MSKSAYEVVIDPEDTANRNSRRFLSFVAEIIRMKCDSTKLTMANHTPDDLSIERILVDEMTGSDTGDNDHGILVRHLAPVALDTAGRAIAQIASENAAGQVRKLVLNLGDAICRQGAGSSSVTQ